MWLRTKEDVGDVIDRRTRTGCVCARKRVPAGLKPETERYTVHIDQALSPSLFPVVAITPTAV